MRKGVGVAEEADEGKGKKQTMLKTYREVEVFALVFM